MDAAPVMADCSAGNAEWAAGEHAAFLVGASNDSPDAVTARAAERAAQAALLRDIFGPLLSQPLPLVAPAVLAWEGAIAARLAAAIYEERGLSPERMGVLADALEEAGCTDAEVLHHLRSEGPHVRGCWVIDLLLGKS
jgi:hypothetical protein